MRTNFSVELRRMVMKEMGIKQQDYSITIKQGLSIRADYYAKEFLAEAFSEFTSSPNPRIIALTAGRIIEKYLKGEIKW